MFKTICITQKRELKVLKSIGNTKNYVTVFFFLKRWKKNKMLKIIIWNAEKLSKMLKQSTSNTKRVLKNLEGLGKTLKKYLMH